MIGKISRGSSFKNCLAYVLRKTGAERIGGSAGEGSPAAIAKEFETVADRRGVSKAVYHISLSLSPGEALSDERWNELAADYLEGMGIDPGRHQHLIAKHTDTKHSHVHLVVNRVGVDNSLFYGQNDAYRSKAVCRELEVKYGLVQVPNSRTPGTKPPAPARKKKSPAQEAAKTALGKLIGGPRLDVRNFCEALESSGIIAVPNISKSGKLSGFSFQIGSAAFKGSEIGAPWKLLEGKLNIESGDLGWLQERKKSLNAASAWNAWKDANSAIFHIAIGKESNLRSALESRGWELRGGELRRDGRSYSLSSLGFEDGFESELKRIQKLSAKQKEKAAAEAKELARKFHGSGKLDLFGKLAGEEALFLLAAAPGLFIALICAQIVLDAVQAAGAPESEAELQARIRAIYGRNSEKLMAEIKSIQAPPPARPEARAETKPKKAPEPISPRPEAGPAAATKAIPDAREKEPAEPIQRRALRRDIGPDRIYMTMKADGEAPGKIAKKLFSEFLEKDARDTLEAAGWKEEAIGAAFEAFQTKAGRAELGRGDFFPDGIL